MKIAIAVNHSAPLIGGSEYVTSQIANYLISKNHDVFIVTRKNKNRNKNLYKYTIVEYNHTTDDYKSFFNKLDNINPDIVMVYSDVFDYFKYLISNKNKFRLIVALCGANWTCKNNAQNLLYRNLSNIERIICHSTHERDYQLCSVNPFLNKTIIIPNGVDIEEFDNNNINRNALLPNYEEKKWVLNISNFFPGKNQKYIIPILNKLNHLNNLIYIQINSSIDFEIGNILENEWKKDVSTKLNKNITCVHKKNISRNEVVSFLKQSNLFILPSGKEIAPISILECMAANLPWVSTDVGNIKDLHGGKYVTTEKNSEYNSIISDRVINTFSNYANDILLNPVIAEAGRKQIERQLNWKLILPMYENIFEKK